MKAKRYLYSVWVGMSLLFLGCSEEFVGSDQAVRKYAGDDIVFGSSASYDVDGEGKSNTRTVYGGYEEGATAEPVYWTAGDDVRVYCPEGSVKVSDYDVDVTGDKVVTTSLSRRGESSLSWGNPAKEHTFYAVYPAPVENSGDLNGNTTITGAIPSVQNYATYKKDGYRHIFAPDMKYAYMVAKTVVPQPNNIGESVYLKFSPIATAVEITLMNNTGRSLNLNRVVCTSEAKNLAGSFKADLGGMTVAAEGNMKYGNSYPEVTDTSNLTKQIEIPLLTDGDSTCVQIGESVTFTVFMLPNGNVGDLKLHIEAVEEDGVGYKTGSFKGITIQQKKKTYLRNISISGKPYTQTDWISYLNPDDKLTALSIPAAGGGASGYKNGGTYYVNDTLRQQNYDIPTLWDMGIRCFEFAIDISSDDDLIGQIYIISGGSSCGIKLGDAVTDVVNQLVGHPDEFAMIILTYQTLGGWAGSDNITRDPARFMTQINTFWQKVSAGLAARNSVCTTALYDPTKTVGDVRGNLFCIARPTSIYQDYGSVQSQEQTGSSPYLNEISLASLNVPSPHEHIMVIQGWGSLKDKWQQRGFAHRSVRKTNVNSADPDGVSRPGRPFDVSTMKIGRSFDFSSLSYTYNLAGNVPVPGNYTITPANLTPDFSYDVQTTDGGTTTDGAWVQEWARVSNMEQVYWYQFEGGATYESLNSGSHTEAEYDAGHAAKTSYWAPSYEEKCTRVEETLNKAIGRSETDKTVYINSLCGYYVDPNVNSSYNPCILTDRNISNGNYGLSGNMLTAGMAGNIHDFAADMNDMFGEMLQKKTANSKVGPMGIIMMDRVGENESSKRIPQIIIANNFQFKLNTSITLPFDTEGFNEASGDVVAAPERRSASEEKGEMTIVWE